MRQPEERTETVTLSQATQKLSQLLDRVSREAARVIIENGEGPVAAIVSIQDLERLAQWESERAERFEALDATRAAFRDVPDDELAIEVSKALESARRKLRGKRAKSQPA